MPVLPVGSLVNVCAIIAGSVVGLFLGARFPERIRNIVFQALGLCTFALGMKMALVFQRPLIVIFSIVLGGIIGAFFHLEEFLATLGDRLKARIKNKNAMFTEGLITATLLFCIGSMAILGAFDEGLRGDPTILLTKSLLDGFASIVLAATYGIGVLFSIIPVFIYQYGLTLFASMFQDVFSPALINELTAVGGVLILGISLNLLKLTYIRLGDMLPALLMVVILGLFLL
ncbi:MAG: DUF554 domain-containing protein [Desulfovibrio sp.]|uniref:DUF554 domain-containing protein n=1 Tax=Desulfovibrio sp. 7SRBS1 TaxID=3378064 RepID=UPI003B41C0BC